MRCQCSICQELFENNDDQLISALDCGHTFHNSCLNQWLENGRTCPSCRAQVNRKRIIQRLYFDSPEDVDEVVDGGRLQNELDTLKLDIRRKDKEVKEAGKEKANLCERLTAVEEAKSRVEKSLKAEQSINSGHLKNLQYHESQQKSLELERKECRRIKQKLGTLQGLETLLNGSELDATDIISTAGEGTGAVQNLSRQVAFLKREYEKLKSEKRQFKDQFEKLQFTVIGNKQKVTELTKESQMLREQLERSEGDLKISEREVEHLRKDNARLKKALKRNPDTSLSSSLTDVFDKSIKMQAFASSTPKLDKPENSENIDLDETPDIFSSPVLNKSQSRTKLKSTSNLAETSQATTSATQSRGSLKRAHDDTDQDAESSSKYRIITTAEKNSQNIRKQKSESSLKDNNSLNSFAAMNIFKKRTLGESQSSNSVSRKGYDGLGGHTTHINPKGNPFFKKPTAKKTLPKSKVLEIPDYEGKMSEKSRGADRYQPYPRVERLIQQQEQNVNSGLQAQQQQNIQPQNPVSTMGGANLNMGGKPNTGEANLNMGGASTSLGGPYPNMGVGGQPGMAAGSGEPKSGMVPNPGLPGLPDAQGPIQLANRSIIWRGELEWQDKTAIALGTGPGARITRSLGCMVSIDSTDQEIVTANWPSILQMQLMPQSLLNSQQLQRLFKKSRQVEFHFHATNMDHLKNLYKVMGNGFAACVHFPTNPRCEIRVMLLLFSRRRRSFVGLIANDQNGMVSGIRQVITQHKLRMQQTQGQTLIGPSSDMQQRIARINIDMRAREQTQGQTLASLSSDMQQRIARINIDMKAGQQTQGQTLAGLSSDMRQRIARIHIDMKARQLGRLDTMPVNGLSKSNVVLEGGGKFVEGRAYKVKGKDGVAKVLIWESGHFVDKTAK